MTKSIEVSTDIKIHIKGTEHILSKEEANSLYLCLKKELEAYKDTSLPGWPNGLKDVTWPNGIGSEKWPGQWPYDLWTCKNTGNTDFPPTTTSYTFNNK